MIASGKTEEKDYADVTLANRNPATAFYVWNKRWSANEGQVKRYIVFLTLGPALGGLLLLLTGAYLSDFLHGAPAEIANVLVLWVTTIHYLFLFGFLPSGIVGAIDDMLCHVKRLNPVWRMLIVGLVGFAAAELLYGAKGSDAGHVQFALYGLVGLIPAMVCSWVSHLWIAVKA